MGAYNEDWFSVRKYGAGGDGATDDTAAIQAAVNDAAVAGGIVYFPEGTYKISGPITLASGIGLHGSGMDAVTIKQHNAAVPGFQGTDLSYLSIRDLTLSGTGTGSKNGINLVRSSASNIPYCEFVNVQCSTWGNAGFYADVLIASRFSGCIARSNGGDGFQLNSTAGNTTSVTLSNCYANANSGTGYELDSAAYCALIGCASDNNGGGGYAFFGAQSCTLTGCGSENNTGTNVLLSGGIGNTVSGLWVNNNTGLGISIASGEAAATVTGCVENSATGATAFIKTAAGTSAVVISDKHTTANSFSAGTAYEIVSTGGTAH